MRIIEILILGTLILTLAAHFWPVAKRPFWTNYFPGAAILMIVVHLATVGYRWQIAPTYALAILLFLLSIPQLLGIRIGSSEGRSRKMLNRIGMALVLVCFALAAGLPVWFPLFEMPNPTGPYAVGTTSFTITDESRPEIFTADPNDKRLIYVQVWYPAGSTDGATRAPMWIYPEEVISTMAKEFLVPEIALSHLASVKSHSTFDAPLAEQEAVYPILVYSHGYDAGFFAQNMVQMEQLASNGYVIFSIGHAYESSLVLDTQGRTIS